jgi:SAM-dependent methyltransferase
MFKFLNTLLGSGKTEKKSAVEAPPSVASADNIAVNASTPPVDLSRIQIMQHMWGDGFSSPGNVDYVIDLAKILLLDSQKSTMNLGSGLGGVDRALATVFKTYVTGFERDIDLATEGMAISTQMGFTRHAPISHFDPEHFVYTKRVDAIIAREILYTIKDKDAFIKKIATMLKPRGYLLLTDFTCDDADYANHASISSWMASQSHSINLTSADGIAKMLEQNGFDVRVNEDLSKSYTRQIMLGLGAFVQILEGKKLSQKTKDLLLTEVDLWARCVGALATKMQNTRFYAIKKT